MSTFETLQEHKVVLAQALLDKFVTMRHRLAVEEAMGGKKIVKDWFKIFARTLEELTDIIDQQKKLCEPSTACSVLLDQELVALRGGNKEVGAIPHLRQVAQGADLRESVVREALIMITSRMHSLEKLRQAA